MSMSKFFHNCFTSGLPQMEMRTNDCLNEKSRETEQEGDDPKIQKTQVMSSDDECNSIASSNIEATKQVVESSKDMQRDPIQKPSNQGCKTTAVAGREVKSRPISLVPVDLCRKRNKEISIEKSTSLKGSILASLLAGELVGTKKSHLPSIRNSSKTALLNTLQGPNKIIDNCVGKTHQEPSMKSIESYSNGITDRRQLLRKADGQENNKTYVHTLQLKSQVKLDHCSDKTQTETAQELFLSSSKESAAAVADQLPDNEDHVENNSHPMQLEDSRVKEKLSLPMIPNGFVTASCIVCEDEVPSTEGSQCSTTTQTLLSSENAEIVKEVPYHAANDRGPTSSLCSDAGPLLSSKLPPGSTLFNSQGVFRTTDKEKPFMCGFCGKTSDKCHVLNRHIAMQHETLEKRYACEICGRRFIQASNLAVHAIQHTHDWPFTCDQCRCRFKSQGALHLHTLKHTKDGPFSCKICHRWFESKSYLLFKHSKVHKEEKGSVICNICKTWFSHRYHLKRHMRRYSGQKAFKCSFCDIQFHLETDLQQHMITHKKTGELLQGDTLDIEASRLSMADPNSAQSCTNDRVVGVPKNLTYDSQNKIVSEAKGTIVREPRTSNSLETISNQTRGNGYSTKAVIRKRISLASGIVYEDEVSVLESSKYSPTTQQLLSGVAKEHPLPSYRQSVNDNVKFSLFRNSVNLKPSPDDALRIYQRVVYTKDKERPFSCGYCGKAYKIKRSLYGHIQIHHEEKRYSCEFCGKRFSRPSDLSKHVRTHTQEKPFSCDQCGKLFRTDNGLRFHKYSHSLERFFHCDQCNKSYKSRYGLSMHKESHKPEEEKKGVACDICKKKFRMPSHLKKHMMIHTGEKPFKCTLCDKQFCQKTQLRTHMDSHQGKKILAKDPCSICGKTLSASRMPDHMRMHAGVKPFECNICGKRFPKRANLEGHMRSHTGEKPFACIGCDKRFTLYSNMVTHKAKCAVLSKTLA